MISPFRTLEQIKKQVKELQDYISLAEGYPETTAKEIAIRQYAFSSSLQQVAGELNARGYSIDGFPYTGQDAARIILSPSQGDRLHRIVRMNYIQKIKRFNRD